MNKISQFNKQVFRKLDKIPRGRVTTYKILAQACGHGGAARAVGNALKRNPDLFFRPCHRVVKSDGSLGGYVQGRNKKFLILRREGVSVKDGRIQNFKKILYKF